MELYQLHSFVTIAREQHLTRAAEKLHASQPAVSAHIKALENELSLQLFIRTSKGMQLTTHGKALYKQAETILQQTKVFLQLGERLTSKPTGKVRIGLNRNADFLKIKPLYQQIRDNYPDLELILQQSVSANIIKAIVEGELDCGFVLGKSDEQKITFTELARFPLRVVGPVSMQEKIEQADRETLATLPWIGVPEGSPYHRIMIRHFHERGFYPPIKVIADKQSTITSMIESGAGLSFMLEEEALLAKRRGQIVLSKKERFAIGLFFIHKSKDMNSPQVEAVKQTVSTIWAQEE